MARALIGHPNHHLIYTAATETFFTYVKVGMFAGLCLSFPIVASQIWMFVAPGLYKHERNAFLPFLIASPVLFLSGAGFVFYVMLPFAINSSWGLRQKPGTANTLGIELLAKVSDYLDFVMTLIFAFGLTFQMPVALALLGRVGIVSAAMLRKASRYAIVGIFGLRRDDPAGSVQHDELGGALDAALRSLDLVRRPDRKTPRQGSRRPRSGRYDETARRGERRRHAERAGSLTQFFTLSIFFGGRSCGRITI